MRASPVLKAVVLASSARLHSGTTTTVAAATAFASPSSSSSPMTQCHCSSRFSATNTARIFGTRTVTAFALGPMHVPRRRAGDFSGGASDRIRPLSFLSAPCALSSCRPSRWSVLPSMPSSIATKNSRQQRLPTMRQHIFHRREETTVATPFATAPPPPANSVGALQRRRWHGAGYYCGGGRRSLAPLAMSTVTEKDVMREFATVAAEEAGLRKKKKLPSDEMREGRRPGASAGAINGEVQEGTAVDSARPTGYKYGDVLTDTDGLPLVYDSDSIGRYWDKRPGELNSRWTRFLSVTVPFATRVVKDYTGGNIMKNEAELARDLRIVIEKLGPTFIKLGQALSIRPDVIGPAATEELAKLQDAVPPFATPLALEVLEQELGRPPSEVFSELSEEPIAAASLAQVYRGVLRSDGRAVAVKIQRPGLVQEVTKDLYVLKRAVGVYQRLSDRWTAQMTDYNELLRVWATGFYQELDFLNEANNQIRMKKVLKTMEGQVFVPDVVLELSTRRLLVSEWVEGVKLTQAEPSLIRELTTIAQEAFLVQLLGEGFMHCDPHPGNMMLVDESMRAERGRLALLDFGLMAELGVREREGMVSALIHTANRDYKSLIEDLVTLEVLPSNTDRGQVEPVMKRVIGPYVFEGGGAKSLNYQSLAKDLARATLEIPFNIPPYFALIARALGILEGVALTGDPDYRIVMEAYPFVTRKIISDDSPALQRALRDILYSEDGKFMAKRLSVLLSYATGVVAADSAVFVDFDTLPSTAASLSQTLKFLLADEARPLRAALVGEASNAADLVLRRATRQAVVRARDLLRPPPPPFPFLPRLPALPLPIPDSVVDAMSPRLTPEEDIFLASLEELAYALAGLEQGAVGEDPIGTVRKLLQPGNDGAAGELAEFVQGLPADSQQTGALLEVGSEVVQNLAERASDRFNGLLSRGDSAEKRRGEETGTTKSSRETSTGGSEPRR